MTTRRLSILNAMVSALNLAPITGLPTTTTRRLLAGDDEDLPAISVWFVSESKRSAGGSSRLGGPEIRVLRVNVQAAVSSVASDNIEALLDPLHEHIDARLGNTTLTELAHVMTIDRVFWEVVKGEKYYGAVTLECSIEYQTTRGDSTRDQ